MFDPLHQFTLKTIIPLRLFGVDISITNSAVGMILTSVITSLLLLLCTTNASRGLLTKAQARAQAAVEALLGVTNSLLEVAIGNPIDNKSKKFAKYVFTIFIFILSLNLAGLVPHSVAPPTAQLAVTLAAGFTSLFVTLGIMLKKHGFMFFRAFVPHGTPIAIVPLIFVLEVFSYLIRPFTIALRLGSNILAGHILLDVLAFLVEKGGVIGIFPFVLMVAINMLEFGIVVLQAYIFAVLITIYIGQALKH